ncbi:hypothetical protein HII36_09620 [Nonomuraea sp. NN258]|uniref:SAF domain-containing protein n=1 Tax=Nonomuraea antri TaxID=2730852 RepID=UPI0015691FAC|nr:SAF domain-containing protein [Nonomuraea antri]NRQ32094.1 hypothetical protein [Nonomuraea antri]
MARKHLPSPPTATANGSPPPVAIATTPKLPRQRRAGMIALALLIVVVGGIAGAQAVIQLSDRRPVVVMGRTVPAGQQVARADLTTTMVAADSTVLTVPAGELGRVVGRRATTDLPVGTLLSPAVVTEVISPLPGTQLVPVAVKPSRVPGRGLRPGDVVVVTFDATDGAKDARPPLPAVVDKVVPQSADGLVVVDLLVDEKHATALGEQAGSGEMVLLLAPRRP